MNNDLQAQFVSLNTVEYVSYCTVSCTAHASSNVTCYEHLFVREKQRQCYCYQALFGE